MSILLPKNGKFFTQSRDELLSDLWSSFGMNFTSEYGKTKVSPRMIITTNNITDLGVAIAFRLYTVSGVKKIFAIAGSYIFSTSNNRTETAFVKSALTSEPSNCSSDVSDLETYNSTIWATTDDKLKYLATTTWTDAGGGHNLTSGVPHKLLNFKNKNRLYVTDSGAVWSASGTTLSNSGANTFTFGTSLSDLGAGGVAITSLLELPTEIWILTLCPQGKNGLIITWDGVTDSTPNKIIPLDSRGALAGIIKDGSPYIITVDGRLQYYNGGTFIDAPNGKLPIKNTKYLKNPLSIVNDRWIHPNGINLVDGRINILINNEYYDNGATIDERVPSGVWEYDPVVGWYPKSSLTLFDIGVGTITDYGQNRLNRVGALANLKTENTSSDTYIGTLLVGAAYFSDATTTAAFGIWTDDSLDTIKKHGYIVTSKQLSKSIKDSFTKLWIRVKKLLSANDKIIVKYRYEEATATELTATWTSATTFTTSTSLLGKETYEVEGLQGAGSGYTAHITKVDVAGNTYTITIDETLGASSGTSKVRVQNWKKLSTYAQQGELAEFGHMVDATWLQLKVCFLFTGDNEMYDMIIENKPKIIIGPYSYNQ